MHNAKTEAKKGCEAELRKGGRCCRPVVDVADGLAICAIHSRAWVEAPELSLSRSALRERYSRARRAGQVKRAEAIAKELRRRG